MNGAMQSQAEAGLDGGADFNKDVQTTIGSQSDGNSALENQQMKSTLPAVVAKLVEHLDVNSQMELVGHSIVTTQTHPHKHTQRHEINWKQARTCFDNFTLNTNISSQRSI